MIDCARVTVSTTEVIEAAFLDSAGNLKTGLTVSVSIRRASDGKILQDDLQWVTSPSALPTATAVDGTNRPGEYAYAFALPATVDEYAIRCDGGSGAANRYAFASLKAMADAAATKCADIEAKALQKFVTDDTGETAAAAGSVAKLSQGAPAITVTPVTQSAGGSIAAKAGVPLWMYEGSAQTFVLSGTDASGSAIDYTGRTLRFVVHDNLDPTTAKFQVEGAGITIDPGGKSVQVQVTPTESANTLSAHRYVLRDLTSNEALNWGGFEVLPSVGST